MENSTPQSDKRIPIAIVGLEKAGKTTLAKRIQTGEFVRTITPTHGLDIESIEIKGNLFQLFDLGGKLPLENSSGRLM